MEHLKTTIKAGASVPFTLIHITDVHLKFTDFRDPVKLIALSEARKLKYPFSEKVIESASQLSKKTGEKIIITGDMTDFFSQKNSEFIKKFTDENNCYFSAGNHDFRPMGGMEYDVPESIERNGEKVQAIYNNNIFEDCFSVNGVKFVSLFNAYYRFNEKQLNYLKEQLKDGLPVILLLHVPLYHKSIYDLVRSNGKRKHASLCAVPDNMITDYPPERIAQQKADEITKETVDFIVNTPQIKAVIAGHLHKNFEVTHTSGLRQILTGIDTIREITIE